TGFLPRKQGTRLYQSRRLAVAVVAENGIAEPVTAVEAGLPEELRRYNDGQTIVSDAAGRVWLLFRHRRLRIRDTPSDRPAHRAAWDLYATTYQGDRWTQPIPVPSSEARQDVKYGVAADGRGNVYLAWPRDHRDSEEFLYKHSEVLAARLPK